MFSGGFGGFPFGGGFSHDDDDDDQPQGEVDNEKYYEELEIPKTATQEQIKKAYLRLAKIYHPDKKSGNAEKFHKIGEAYETLKDPQKRRMYDKYGTKGPGESQEDILNMFFGGGGARRAGGKRQMPKVKPTQKPLNISLENIYNGEMLKFEHTRTRCCEACEGKGGKNVQKCKTCKGNGRVMQMYQMGPGMYQQVQKNCDKCSGQGEIIGEGGKCKECNGKKIVEKKKIIEVSVDKGIPNEYPIKLAGEGNQIPDALAGDLILITQEQPHEIFTRKGADLFMKRQITLLEALTGFDFKLKHLDGSEYTIYTKSGEIVGDHEKKVVRGLGMPFHKDQMSHGNLIIEFKVMMPKRGEISKENLEALANILPGKVNKRPLNDDYVMLDDFDPENLNEKEEGGKKEEAQYDEDYEHEAGNIGCNTH